MADYQEYRRRVLHRRWRRRFMAAGLLLLLIMLGAIGLLWKRLHREQRPSGVVQNAILQPVTQDNTWNTVGYAPARQLSIQTRSGGSGTALDFRMAALPENTAVEKSWFNDVTFVGDSLTQGMQLYDEGLPNAMFCAYKGVGPNVIVNGATCRRADGETEVPLEALNAQQPRAIYVLLGTNVLGRDTDYTSFLTGYAGPDHPERKNLCAVHHAGAAGGEQQGEPRRLEQGTAVPHQRRAGSHRAG